MSTPLDTLAFSDQGIRAFGDVAQTLLANQLNTGRMRPWVSNKTGRAYVTVNGRNIPVANALLRKDEWKQYDKELILAAQDRLVGIADLRSRGLVYSTNGLAKTVLEYEDASDINDALMSMDGLQRGENDRLNTVLKYLPLPIIHKGWTINARVLAASRTTGQPIDTTMGQMAAIKVADFLENLLFNGASSYKYGGGTIYGYVDHPSAQSVTLAQNWDASGKTGAEIKDDVLAMIQKLINAKRFGKVILYIPTAYETILEDDYTSGYQKTIRQRLMEIERIQDIKVADKLPANTVVMVEMVPTTVRLVEGMPLQTVQWSEEGNMVSHYKAMTIAVPQIRADQEGNCGVVVLS